MKSSEIMRLARENFLWDGLLYQPEKQKFICLAVERATDDMEAVVYLKEFVLQQIAPHFVLEELLISRGVNTGCIGDGLIQKFRRELMERMEQDLELQGD